MTREQDVLKSGAEAFIKVVGFAVESTGTPPKQLTSADFEKAATIAEQSGNSKMAQQLLLLAEYDKSKRASGSDLTS